MTQDEQIAEYKDQYDKWIDNVGYNQIPIRKDIVLKLGHDESRYGFEFFVWRSPPMIREMDLFIKYATEKRTFLDIGSYHGIFSMVFTEINNGSVAYAFEPFQKSFEILNANCQASKNIVPVNAALSDNTGKLQLFEYGGHLNSNKISEDQTSVYVNAVTGDAFCYGCYPNIAPGIIKIDVEGNELKVLRGLSNVLATHRPMIFLELHYGILSKDEVREIMEIIGWYKYTIIDTETGLEMPLSSLLLNRGEKRIILK